MAGIHFWVGGLYFSCIIFGYGLGIGFDSYGLVPFVIGVAGMSRSLKGITDSISEHPESSNRASNNHQQKDTLNEVGGKE